jgi:formyl-CoA transferase
LLGDMGADVIKVEPPVTGDPMREWGQGSEKVQWEVIARNKRSVSANLRVPEGQALVRRLIAHADVLIENSSRARWKNGAWGRTCCWPNSRT